MHTRTDYNRRTMPTGHTMRCQGCHADNPSESRFCGTCGRVLAPQPDVPCKRCGAQVRGTAAFCPKCGLAVTDRVDEVIPVVPAETTPALARQDVAPRRGGQSRLFALLLGLIIPGAGQAYNGQPIKGFFFFFFSILILPFLFSLVDAWNTAARMREAGQSSGCSGFIWVGLQIWLLLNTVGLIGIGLTIAGVFQ